jgi:hypothetical protein
MTTIEVMNPDNASLATGGIRISRGWHQSNHGYVSGRPFDLVPPWFGRFIFLDLQISLMPTFGNGISTSMTGLLMGLVQSSLVMGVAASLAGTSAIAGAGLAALSLIGLIELSHRANYWGIAYTGGWGLGLILAGPQLMSGWEFQATALVVFAYFALKVARKIEREF